MTDDIELNGELEDKQPKSFIFNRGQLGKNTKMLIKNLRNVMSPYTATNLRATKKNSLKDFIRMASPFGITHLITISRPTKYAHLRFIVLPSGPTFDFEIREFSLQSSSMFAEKRLANGNPYKNPAVLIMNNFPKDEPHYNLIASMFQNLFPSLNITKTKLERVNRIVLLHYDKEQDMIYFRHYYVHISASGVSQNLRYFLHNKLPDLESFKDISDFISSEFDRSEEDHDTSANHSSSVKYTKRYRSSGMMRSSTAQIKLDMIGPSMTLKIIKIQEGISDKKVLYHSYVSKTPEEIIANEQRIQQRQELKVKRKQEQEDNVIRKKKAKKLPKANKSNDDTNFGDDVDFDDDVDLDDV